MGKFFETVVLETLRPEWMNASLNFLAKSMNSPKDFSLELRESLMKVVAQVWADLFFMKERVKAIFSHLCCIPHCWPLGILVQNLTRPLLWWGFHQSYWVDLDEVLWVVGGEYCWYWWHGWQLRWGLVWGCWVGLRGWSRVKGEWLTKVMCEIFDLFFIFLVGLQLF